MAEKLLSVFYYIGHIVSDLFTARGLPINYCALFCFDTREKPVRFLPENIDFATFFNVLAQIRYSPLDHRRLMTNYEDL